MLAFTTTNAGSAIIRSTFTQPNFAASHKCNTPVRRRVATPGRAQPPTAQLIGIPEHLRGSNEPTAEEVLLAELRFSDPSRLPALIEAALPQLDEAFYEFLEKTINESSDLEERENLRALRDAITSIMKQMYEEIAKQQEEKSNEQAADQTVTTEATELDTQGNKKKVSSSVRQSFDELINLMISSYDESDPKSIKASVDLNYHRIDISFLERLSERIVSAGDQAPQLSRLRDAINDVMNERVTQAMSSLRLVLSSGPPAQMKMTVDALTRQGRIDDAFILLLQANVDEAHKAHASDAVRVLSEVLEYATQQKDREVAPEIRLIRKLLRTGDDEEAVEARRVMLTESFEAGAPVLLPDGTKSIGTKVDGKKFVTALRSLIEDFGNVDEDFILKLSKIGEESEAVARKIYDMEGKEVQELQDEAFHKRSVSVWDLEEFEQQETAEGRTAPWEGQLGTIPEKMGFGEDGKLSV